MKFEVGDLVLTGANWSGFNDIRGKFVLVVEILQELPCFSYEGQTYVIQYKLIRRGEFIQLQKRRIRTKTLGSNRRINTT